MTTELLESKKNNQPSNNAAAQKDHSQFSTGRGLASARSLSPKNNLATSRNFGEQNSIILNNNPTVITKNLQNNLIPPSENKGIMIQTPSELLKGGNSII